MYLLQFICGRTSDLQEIHNKTLDFWNLVDTYTAYVVIGTKSRLREEIRKAEVLRAAFTIFRTDRLARVWGVFICVKNCNAYANLWVDEDLEMIAVEVKSMDPKYTWAIINIYRAPYEDMRVIERLAVRTGYSRNSTKRSIIGGNLNLPQADWNGSVEGTSGNQYLLIDWYGKTNKRRW